MKKIDKFILGSFIGPFLLTFLVVVFILLTQHMLKYFDDIIGKDLGWDVLGQLLFYFAIFMTPVAMPLAVLLSSLITFGNLGEHFELTAIKSAGISLLRVLQPIFFFVILLTGIAFWVNNNLVPKAALEAYSLLYDIKQKKPALDLREGSFYNGIPDISIKVNKKFDDGITLKGVIVYDHRKNDGNKEVTVADSGKMYTILNERYLKFELFNGYNYTEGAMAEREMAGMKNNRSSETLSRSKFAKTQVVFDLSSFKLERTDKKWFQGNRIMRNLGQLDHDIDSINNEINAQRLNHYLYKPSYFQYYAKGDSVIMPVEIYRFKLERDSANRVKYMPSSDASNAMTANAETKSDTVRTNKPAPSDNTFLQPRGMQPERARLRKERLKGVTDMTPQREATKNEVAKEEDVQSKKRPLNRDSLAQVHVARLDSFFATAPTRDIIQSATNMARQVKSQVQNGNASIANYENELRVFEIQWHRIIANSLACIAMFLIGAPLGAIIKRGGLGVPFLVSILFFIIYYLLNMQGEKWAKTGAISAVSGVWAADFILLIIGMVFLRQARVDARLFDADFYRIFFDRLRQRFPSNQPGRSR
ncbi:MAG: LptF/LptG family permease [Bacteroidota bacterium]